MASDNKDGKSGGELTKKVESQSVEESKHDLDTNPIKYATSEPGKYELEPHDKDYMEMTLRHGKHSDYVKQILRQRTELRAKEFPRWPAQFGSGVRVMWIESRFWYDRERLSPDFDDDWRSYRARYLHSLELDPREPVHVPEYELSLINPIRRFYQKPGDLIEKHILMPIYKGNHLKAQATRGGIGQIFIGLALVSTIWYWLRYNQSSWEVRNGPYLSASRPRIFPSDPRFPFKDYRTEPVHHYDAHFLRRKAFKDLRDYEDITVVL